MGITKRANGYYYLYTQTPAGKRRISLETKDERLAQEIYNAFLLDRVKAKVNRYTACDGVHAYAVSSPSMARNSSLINPPRPDSPLLSTIYNQYLDSAQNREITEAVLYAKRRLAKGLKKQRLTRISNITTPQNISKLLKALSKIGTYTAEMHIRNFKDFLNHLIKTGLFSRNDYELLLFPPKRQAVRDVVIPEKDYQRLLKTATDRDFALYLQTLWETGSRPNEIVNLKKSEIDFAKGLARIFPVLLGKRLFPAFGRML